MTEAEESRPPAESNRVWVLIALVAFLPMTRFVFSASTTLDYWHFLAKGARLLKGGLGVLHVPQPFVFTAPAGSAFVDKEWLFGLGLRAWWEWTGHGGTTVFRGLVVLGCVALFFALCKRLGASAWTSLWIFWLGGMSVVLTRIETRPHLIGYFLLMLLFWMIHSPPTRRSLFAVGGMFVLWANIHGSFVLGGALLGAIGTWALVGPWWHRWRGEVEAAENASRWRAWWALLPLLPLLVCINPHGWRLWRLIWMFQKEISSQPDPIVAPEWIAFRIDNPYGMFLVASLGFFLLTWLLPKNRHRTIWLGWVLALALLGYSNLRFVGIVFLLSGPLLAMQLDGIENPRLLRIAQSTLAILAVLQVSQAWSQAPPWHFYPSPAQSPVHVMDAINLANVRTQPKRPWNLFIGLKHSGYALFRSHGKIKVSYDGFPQVPGFRAWSQEYKHALLRPRIWESYCKKHRCDLVLLDMKTTLQLPLAVHLLRHPGWRPVFLGLRWVLYARSQSNFPGHRYPHLRSFFTPFQLLPETRAKRTAALASLKRQGHTGGLLPMLLALETLQSLGITPSTRWPTHSPARLNMTQASQKLLQQAYQQAPWHPGVQLALGLAFTYHNDPRAVALLQKAQAFNPQWTTPKLLLLRLWKRLNNTQRAHNARQALMQTSSGRATYFHYLRQTSTQARPTTTTRPSKK